jgi:protein SCO1/2
MDNSSSSKWWKNNVQSLPRRSPFTPTLADRVIAAAVFFSLAIHLGAAPPEPETQAPRRAEVPDTELVNQNGQKVHLYSDLIKGRVVAISFIFTSCPTICRSIGVNLGQLQTELGPSLGKEVSLISITVDPEKDTPEELKKWGKQFDAGAGWSLLTGPKSEINQLLKKLEVFTPDIQSHTPFMLIVDDRTGDWTRVNVLTTPPHKIGQMLGKLARGDRG